MLTSLPDLLIIGGAALLIFGPKRLPELAKSLGKGIREFKKAVDGEDDQSQQQQVHQVLPPANVTTPQQQQVQQAQQAQPTPTGSGTSHD